MHDDPRFHLLRDERLFIDGISDYCDRWCEHCPMTSHCHSFNASSTIDETDEIDQENIAFWSGINDTCARTRGLLGSVAWEGVKENGELNDETAGRGSVVAGMDDLMVTNAAARYSAMVNEWFDTDMESYQRRIDEFSAMAQMGLEYARPVEQGELLEEAIEVIRWYQMQIQIKLMRGISTTEAAGDVPGPEFARQADGAAKVALVGIDRSIGAWGSLYERLPEMRSGIMAILAQLDRLGSQVERLFPDARAFRRPGFDGGEGI